MAIFRQFGKDSRNLQAIDNFVISTTDLINASSLVKRPSSTTTYSSVNHSAIVVGGHDFTDSATLTVAAPVMDGGIQAACTPRFGLTLSSLSFSGDTSNINVGDLFLIYPSENYDPEISEPATFIVEYKRSNDEILFTVENPGYGFTNSSEIYVVYINLNNFLASNPLSFTLIPNKFCISDIVITNEGSGYDINKGADLITVDSTGDGFYGSLLSFPKYLDNTDYSRPKLSLNRNLPAKPNKFGVLQSRITPQKIVNKKIYSIEYPNVEKTTNIQNYNSYTFDMNKQLWTQNNFTAQNDSSSNDQCTNWETAYTVTYFAALGIVTGWGIAKIRASYLNDKETSRTKELIERIKREKALELAKFKKIEEKMKLLIRDGFPVYLLEKGYKKINSPLSLQYVREHITEYLNSVKSNFNQYVAEANIADSVRLDELWKASISAAKKNIIKWCQKLDMINLELPILSNREKNVYGAIELFINGLKEYQPPSVVTDVLEEVEDSVDTDSTKVLKASEARKSLIQVLKDNSEAADLSTIEIDPAPGCTQPKTKIKTNIRISKTASKIGARKWFKKIPLLTAFFATLDVIGGKSVPAATFDAISPVTTDDWTELLDAMSQDMVFDIEVVNTFLAKSEVIEELKRMLEEMERERYYVGDDAADRLINDRLYAFFQNKKFWRVQPGVDTPPEGIFTDAAGEEFSVVEISDADKVQLVSNFIESMNNRRNDPDNPFSATITTETYEEMRSFLDTYLAAMNTELSEANETLAELARLSNEKIVCECSQNNWDIWMAEFQSQMDKYLSERRSSANTESLPPPSGGYLWDLQLLSVEPEGLPEDLSDNLDEFFTE
jgi:hypothetical protein